MAGYIDVPYMNVLADEDLAKYRRVKLTAAASGSNPPQVSYADAGESAIGVTRTAVADGDPTAIILVTKDGTVPMVASGAISANALVYPANDGKVTATVTGRAVGRNVGLAATADEDVIEVLPLLEELFSDQGAVHGFFDDMQYLVTADRFTIIATDSGTALGTDAAGGVVQLRPSDGTVADNDEVYVHTTWEQFLFAANKPLWFEARVKVTEANTDDSNVVIGLMSASAANHLLDNGGGPAASYDGAVFYKVDGGTTWLAELSIAGTQTAVTLSASADTTVDGDFHKFGIEFIPTSSTTATVNFYIDGVLAGSTTTFTFTGATEMDAIVGCKNGGANNETVDIDYIAVRQVR